MNTNAPQLPSSPDIPLHDIKPLMEVPDNSLMWFILLVSVVLVVAGVIIYLIVKWMRKRRAGNVRRHHFELLQGIDFSDPKRAAYAITRYGYTFASDEARVQEAYDNLVERLAPYKYKKEVDPIDDETVGYYNIFVGMIDV